jgi:hypothetical protein
MNKFQNSEPFLKNKTKKKERKERKPKKRLRKPLATHA